MYLGLYTSWEPHGKDIEFFRSRICAPKMNLNGTWDTQGLCGFGHVHQTVLEKYEDRFYLVL